LRSDNTPRLAEAESFHSGFPHQALPYYSYGNPSEHHVTFRPWFTSSPKLLGD